MRIAQGKCRAAQEHGSFRHDLLRRVQGRNAFKQIGHGAASQMECRLMDGTQADSLSRAPSASRAVSAIHQHDEAAPVGHSLRLSIDGLVLSGG